MDNRTDMEIITLKIKNKNKFQHFLNFIKDLDYVEVIPSNKRTPVSEDDFFALTGMWEKRDITKENLRAKAWPKTK